MEPLFTTSSGRKDDGFFVRDLVRFFVVDIILIAAVRLLLALGMFSTMDAYVMTLLASKVVLFCYLAWLIQGKRGAWRETGIATGGRWQAWLVCLVLYGGFLYVSEHVEWANNYFMAAVYRWFGWVYRPEPQDIVILIFENLLAWPSRMLLVFFTVLAGPFMEELAFRGMGMDAYRRESGTAWAVFMTSVLFGAYHFSLQYLVPLTILGALFAFARLYARSLWCAVFIHCVHNFVALAVTAHNVGMI